MAVQKLENGERCVYTGCMGTGCHEYCVLTTVVKDGKVARTQMTDFGDSEGIFYGICQKGAEYARFPYIEKRLKYPLKRVGPRGSGQFERISWEQAMDEIGEKLRAVRDKYGPESVLFNKNMSGYPTPRDALNIPLQYRFIDLFGGTASFWATLDSGYFMACSLDYGSAVGYGFAERRLLADAKHIILWGTNAVGATRASATSRHIMTAQERGAKIVDIGIVYDSTAANSDQFVPIHAGTDYALAMAMSHVIVKEGIQDDEFLIRKTVAPFLVRDDNGKFLRESDIVEGGNPANYVFWDSLKNAPAFYRPRDAEASEGMMGALEAKAITYVDESATQGTAPDLNAVMSIAGISCKTAFVHLKEAVEEWTPERQETLTGVPAETVYQLVHEYFDNKPAYIFYEMGLRYRNAGQSYRAIQTVAMLSGNIGMSGGGIGCTMICEGWPAMLNQSGIMYPEGPEKAKGHYVYTEPMYEGFRNGDSPYHAMILTMGNIMHCTPGRQIFTDHVLPQMELIVSYEVRMTDTCLLSDYVLPDTSTFEREEILVVGNHIVLQEKAIEPVDEQKAAPEFWRMLAEQVGLGEYFNKTTDEWFEILLQTWDPAIASVEPKITLERLREEKMIRLNVPHEPYNGFSPDQQFMTNSGRIEFYHEGMVENADAAIPRWTTAIYQDLADKYPLHLQVGRHRVFMQTQFVEFDDLAELVGREPWMWLNGKDAADRDIKDGEIAEVFNHLGCIKCRVRTTQAVPPGTCHMWLGFTDGSYPEGGPTRLNVPPGVIENQDKYLRQWFEVQKDRWGIPEGEPVTMEYLTQGRLPDLTNFETSLATNADTIFDMACEVRKCEEA